METPPREWWPNQAIYDRCRVWIYSEQRYCGGTVSACSGYATCQRCGEHYGIAPKVLRGRNVVPTTRKSDQK